MLIERKLLKNDVIVMNRGDTKEVELLIYDDTTSSEMYTMQGNDVVYLGIMDPHQPFENALVKKKYTVDDFTYSSSATIVTIYPEDTLDLMPGRYYYAVKLKIDHYDENGNRIQKVKTIIDKTKFIICD